MYGATPVCPRCSKAVYQAEQTMGPGRKLYHKPCLACTSCNKRLDSFTLLEHAEEPYCKSCHLKLFGTRDLRHANLPQASPPASPTSASPVRATTTGSTSWSPTALSTPRTPPRAQPQPSFWATTRSASTVPEPSWTPRSVSTIPEPSSTPRMEPQPQGVVRAPAWDDDDDDDDSQRGDVNIGRSGTATYNTSNTTAQPEADGDEDVEMGTTPPAASPEHTTDAAETADEAEVHAALIAPAPPTPARPTGAQHRAQHGDGSPSVRAIPINLTGTPYRSYAAGSPMGTPTGTPMGASTHSTGGGAVTPLRPQGTGARWGATAPDTPLCARCKGRVYFAEQVKAVGQTFHKGCLRCASCSTALDSRSLRDHEGVLCCARCYSKNYGPQGGGYALLGKAGG